MGYLVDSDNNIENIVILDDNDDGISNFLMMILLVNRAYGLNEEMHKKSIKELE